MPRAEVSLVVMNDLWLTPRCMQRRTASSNSSTLCMAFRVYFVDAFLCWLSTIFDDMSLVVQSPLAFLFCGLPEVAQFVLTWLFEPENTATINSLLRMSTVSSNLVRTTARSVIWELAHPLLLARVHLKTQTASSPAKRAARRTLAPLIIAVKHALQFVQESDVKMLEPKLKLACCLDTRGWASTNGLSKRNKYDASILRLYRWESTVRRCHSHSLTLN